MLNKWWRGVIFVFMEGYEDICVLVTIKKSDRLDFILS